VKPVDHLSRRLLAAADRYGLQGPRGSRAISPYFELTTEEAAHLLQGLVAVDVSQIQKRFGGYHGDAAFPILRGIQTGRVRYERADPLEHWQSWREIVEQMDGGGIALGDCEDLSAAVVGELLFGGISARPYVYQSGPKLYHVVVQTPRWGFLDPSRAAGMEGSG